MNTDLVLHHNPSLKTLNEWLRFKHNETNYSYSYIIHNLLNSIVQIMNKKNTSIEEMNELRIDVSKHIYKRWSKYPEHTHLYVQI